MTPGLGVQSALWSGDRWVVGTNQGIFLSPTGEDAWTVASPIVPGVKQSSLALHGHALFIGFDVNTDFSLSQSLDDGSTWSPVETVLNAFVYQLAAQGGELFAARADGLWFRSVATVSVGGDGAGDLRFALAGRQPVHESARFHFDLPRADAVAIEVFDVAGRRAPGRIEGVLPAGGHDVTWDTRGLAAGVVPGASHRRGRESNGAIRLRSLDSSTISSAAQPQKGRKDHEVHERHRDAGNGGSRSRRM